MVAELELRVEGLRLPVVVDDEAHELALVLHRRDALEDGLDFPELVEDQDILASTAPVLRNNLGIANDSCYSIRSVHTDQYVYRGTWNPSIHYSIHYSI